MENFNKYTLDNSIGPFYNNLCKPFNKSFNTKNELIKHVMENKFSPHIMFSIVLYNNEYIMDYSDHDDDGFKRPLYFYDILVNSDYLYL